MTVRSVAFFVAFLAVATVAVPLSFVAVVLAHAADWLDDLCYDLLDGMFP
jgi:hypothetical protein